MQLERFTIGAKFKFYRTVQILDLKLMVSFGEMFDPLNIFCNKTSIMIYSK